MSIELFSHQSAGIDFLAKRKGAILADEMGLGKSRQAIVAVGNKSGVLNVVVCPASLKLNWEREINMVYPEDKVLVGSIPDALKIYEPAWLVINYDQLAKWVPAISGFKYSLVGDEAHYIKGRSQRTNNFMKIARAAERVYLLTGTPILNRPIDLYNLLKAIRHPLAFTKRTGKDNWFGYGMRYCSGFRQKLKDGRSFMNVRGASHLDELKEKISDSFLRRMKSEVMDLPEKIIQEVPVELSVEYRKKYETAFDAYIEFLRANPIEGKNIDNVLLARHLVELQKLKQVCSEAKMDAVMSDIESAVESEEKVAVFTGYTKTLIDLRNEIYDRKLRCVTLSGEDSIEERQKSVDCFQGGGADIFVGNIKAAGVGITLTAATNVFFADLDWTPATHDQAMDRCHRIGTTGTVNVRYYVARDTVEEDIMAMLASKRRVIEKVLSGEQTKEADTVSDVIGRIQARCG